MYIWSKPASKTIVPAAIRANRRGGSFAGDSGVRFAMYFCASLPLVGGCLDVQQYEQSPSGAKTIKVDDFEDGDTLPSTSPFRPWECYAFQDVQTPPKCSIVAGNGNGFGYSIEFELQVPPGYEDIGIGYGTTVGSDASGKRRTLDGSALERIDFDARWDTDSPELDETHRLQVHLPCTSLNPDAAPGIYAVEHGVDLGRAWSHYSALISEFVQPAWTSQRIDRQQCLTAVDGILFNLEAPKSLSNGNVAGGSITIDNVYVGLPPSTTSLSITSVP